ncbi:WD40 repeat-containing protein [Artemisia annua]|uniref:WD40 repeat-containing protein n=1 Tax=Artemisia annua TaxID=35608 RepID=A0A2U1NLV1_ARTAN|nr:WD40 repeat-containing protein [Artemisia annua]
MKKHAVVDIFGRQLGNLSTRKFAYNFSASEDLVMRLERARTLEKHSGSVNTVSFNADGDILVSGSDDREIIFWDWETGSVKLSFNSGHRNNVLQAKIMPETDDRSIVTCGADGQVRHATILECGKVETKPLAIHKGRAHKIANVPESPHIFYSCGDDGLVLHFDLRTRKTTKLFTCRSSYACSCCQQCLTKLSTGQFAYFSFPQVVNLNAIAIDPCNPNLFVVGGSDMLTRLYDIRKYTYIASDHSGEPADHFCPKHLLFSGSVRITGLAYSDQSELLVSYSTESMYRFSKEMGWGSNIRQIRDNFRLALDSEVEMVTESKQAPLIFKGHKNNATEKGVGFFGPKCEYVVSGSDCGRMFIWRNKDAKLLRVIEADNLVVKCFEAHPRIPILASSGIDRDIKIWTPTALERATPYTIIE